MIRKILVINWRDMNNPEAGGAEIYYHEIFRRLVDRGFDITVLSHSWTGASTDDQTGRIHVIRKGNKFLFNFSIIPYIIRNSKKFDLIIENINKVPFLTPLFARTTRLHIVHHFFEKTIFRETVFPLALYIYLMEKTIGVFYKKEKFIAVSESTKTEIENFGVSDQSISIVSPGINTSFFYQSKPKNKGPLLVYVGRLMKYKNVQFIIRAFPKIKEKYPDAELKIAGSGGYLKELKLLCADLGIENSVQFVGWISEEQKRDLLSSATIFVNPSHKEGWGINNIEANLCGTVSLSNNVPGLRDSVQNNVTGLLYEPENIEDFVAKAQMLISDKKLRSKLEANALERAKSLDWDKIALKMENVLKQI